MKKLLNCVLYIALLTASFLLGSKFSYQKNESTHLSHEKSVSVASGEAVDSSIDIDIDDTSMRPGAVNISYAKQQMIGVRTGPVEKNAVTHTLRFSGIVAPDENRIYKINAAVDGIIHEVFPSTTGTMVKKGQILASFYSPDIYAAVQGYLIALSSDRYQNNLQVQVNESRLLYLGMTASQIESLKKKQEIEEIITLQAPATGVVLNRTVSPEFRFLKGEELYRIVDLNRVWIFADIYENESKYLQPKTTATVSHPQLDRKFQAKVSDVLPLFDAATRTLKVRLEMDNPEFLLRPDMFVDIELPITFPNAIAVPADAILDSGLNKIVFIDMGNGFFEPRKVETGWHFDNQVEIAEGLEPGERIVTSGAFLIDSESRLETAASGMHETFSKDPVSGWEISINKAEKAGIKSVYDGKTYYFESKANKEKFEKSPDQYIKQ
jgi:membrane fusion protein, copper/silver efflux system